MNIHQTRGQERKEYKTWPDHNNPAYNSDTVRRELLGNFPQWMPGGFYRTGALANSVRTYSEMSVGDITGYSPLFLKHTPAAFFQVVDAAIEEAGIAEELIPHLVTIGTGTSFVGGESEIELLLFDVYEILRKKGYYQQELMT